MRRKRRIKKDLAYYEARLIRDFIFLCIAIIDMIFYFDNRNMIGLMGFAIGALLYWTTTEDMPNFFKQLKIQKEKE